jgi:hypothetical protein
MTTTHASAGRALAAAVGSVIVGVLVWGVALLVGISADIIGVVFYRPEDYPYASAWVIGSAVLGGAAAGTVLWLARPSRSVDR